MEPVIDTATRAQWANNLKAQRKRCKLTRYDLAHKLGVHYQSVWRWEQADNKNAIPRDGMKREIARALRTDVYSLFPIIVTEEAS